MSKQETVDIAATAVLKASSDAKFAEVLKLWLSMVYDTAYLVALDKHTQPTPSPLPNTASKTTVDLGCEICRQHHGGKVMGFVCAHPRCPSRVTS